MSELYSRAEADITAAENEESKSILAELQKKPENRICIDCPSKVVTWCTLTYGAFMCLDCSARHRAMGAHVSFVRSVTLDKFGANQTKRMVLGGNGRLRQYFSQHGLTDARIRYDTPAMRQYKQMLDRLQKDGVDTLASKFSASTSGPLSPTTPVEEDPMPLSPSTVDDSITSPVSASISFGSLAAKPKPAAKRRGLGGTKVAVGSLKEDKNAPKVEAPAKKKEVSTFELGAGGVTQKKPADNLPGSVGKGGDMSSSHRGRYYGIGSEGQDTSVVQVGAGDEDPSYAPKSYGQSSAGPDFSGFGSDGAAAPLTGGSGGNNDWALKAYNARVAVEGAASAAKQTTAYLGEAMKSFLDGL